MCHHWHVTFVSDGGDMSDVIIGTNNFIIGMSSVITGINDVIIGMSFVADMIGIIFGLEWCHQYEWHHHLCDFVVGMSDVIGLNDVIIDVSDVTAGAISMNDVTVLWVHHHCNEWCHH